jgi:DNA-binding LacI/PurR family transcriptional regulator
MEGYKKALKEFNIEFEDILVAEGGAQKVQGENAARKIFEKNKDNPPDALFAANDMMAFGAMKYIIENGIKIPADVAVAGFDDVSAAAHVIPSLTTVRVNRNLLIERCVDLLDQQINGNALEFPLNECIKTEIVIREST